MAYDIAPLRPEDLDELGRFLVAGFRAPPDAEFAAADVLRWKYLDPRPGADDGGPRSFVARGIDGRIVGHVGLALTAFRWAGTDSGVGSVAALHMMDWLGSPGSPGVGAALMRRAHGRAEVQYGLGGSEAGRATIARAGYAAWPPLPVLRRVLRPAYRLRDPDAGPLRRALLAARDLGRAAPSVFARERVDVALRPVDRFGEEVEAVVARVPGPLLFTGRTPGALNATLAYPRGGPAGWLVEQGGAVRGFAVTNVVGRGPIRAGKVVDLFLDAPVPALWRGAAAALASLLRDRGADVALACGGTPWADSGLLAAGYRPSFALDLQVRDRKGVLPRGVPRHLSFLEADYAHTE